MKASWRNGATDNKAIGKRYLFIIALLAVLPVLLLSGCSSRPANTLQNKAGYFGLTDKQGNSVRCIAKPQRIVSLNLRSDEILLDLVPAERIAALSYLADDGEISNVVEQAKQIPQRVTLSAEYIIYLQPDLVIATESQPMELIQILRDAKIPVYIYKNPKSVAEVRQVIADMAGVVGEQEAGIRMIHKMETELAVIEKKVQKIPLDERKIVVRFTIMGGGGGQGSSFDDACRYAGVRNGAALAGLGMNQHLSKEQIVNINPDVFLMPSWDYYGKTDMQQYKTDIVTDPAFQTLKAVRQKRIVEVPDNHMLCTSQYMVHCVRDIFNAAYPELAE
ncbi:MAG: ABC transporter substrate-binding protein [Veillonellales bacterium]